jgi:hypothetical protein
VTAGQLHFELVADMKLETELTTVPASLVMVAICAGVGLDDSPATELLSAFTDDVMALVWVGKSPLAWSTSLLALFSIAVTCALRPLTPLLAFRLVSPLTEFSRLALAEQYAGGPLLLLLLLQPASATTPAPAAKASDAQAQAPPCRARALLDFALSPIVIPIDATGCKNSRRS